MTEVPASSKGQSTVPAADRKLDDILLAMDVVDTLRHRDQLVARELDDEGRESDLLERLKDIYKAQGIDVPDRILKDGVAALKEKRFAYVPPKNSLMVRLARLYVSRDRWLKPVVAGTAALAVGFGAYQVGVAGPERTRIAEQRLELTQTLPNRLAALRTDIQTASSDPEADTLAETLYQDGVAALDDKDIDTAKALIADLETLKTDLARSYEVRVRYGNGAQSGIFRIPNDSPGQRNYYLIVEAVDARGNVLDVPIFDEEKQIQKRTDKWGQRVTEAVFNAVASDKRDDQIIQNAVIGQKPAGQMTPVYSVDTPGGSIVEWETE